MIPSLLNSTRHSLSASLLAALMATLTPLAASADSAARASYSGPLPQESKIMSTSDFIHFKDLSVSTLVPKGAVLHVPERYRSNMVETPADQFVMWRPFLTRNIGRVVPLEVTPEQAAGIKPIEADKLEAATRTGRIVIAVIGGNPTSVKRPTATNLIAKSNS